MKKWVFASPEKFIFSRRRENWVISLISSIHCYLQRNARWACWPHHPGWFLLLQKKACTVATSLPYYILPMNNDTEIYRGGEIKSCDRSTGNQLSFRLMEPMVATTSITDVFSCKGRDQVKGKAKHVTLVNRCSKCGDDTKKPCRSNAWCRCYDLWVPRKSFRPW